MYYLFSTKQSNIENVRMFILLRDYLVTCTVNIDNLECELHSLCCSFGTVNLFLHLVFVQASKKNNLITIDNYSFLCDVFYVFWHGEIFALVSCHSTHLLTSANVLPYGQLSTKML